LDGESEYRKAGIHRKRCEIFIPRVGFEPGIQVFERPRNVGPHESAGPRTQVSIIVVREHILKKPENNVLRKILIALKWRSNRRRKSHSGNEELYNFENSLNITKVIK
jgi:hypothetical protein